MKYLLIIYICLVNVLYAVEKYETTKTSCVFQSNYSDKHIDELKQILLDQAKRESLEELYGNILYSETKIKDGKLISDEIRSRAVGAVRVSGNPKFYNGKNLGEICTDVKAYITKKDLQKYSPKDVKLKRFCYTNKKTSIGNLKNRAKENAYIEAIVRIKPSMKNMSYREAEKLIHGFTMTNENFDISASAYCFDAVATLMPYELEMINSSHIKTKKNRSDLKNLKRGLEATFYAKNDYDMKKPLYTMILTGDSWWKNKKIANGTLQPDNIYLIQIEGFLKTENRGIDFLKLIQDVYSVNVRIDDKEILTDKRVIAKVGFKANSLHKIDVVLKTAEKFDISLLAKSTAEDSYQPIATQNLYH